MDDSNAPAPDCSPGSQEEVSPRRCAPVGAAPVEYGICYVTEMPHLILYLMKCGASAHDAAEAAQRAFAELLDKWETVRNPSAWLRKVAFRIFLRMAVDDELPLEPHFDGPGLFSASERIEFREEEQAVLAALRQLPPTQLEVFALYYDQFEIREIAELLQMKEAAVRQNLSRARARLRELLGLPPRGITSGRDGPVLESEGGI